MTADQYRSSDAYRNAAAQYGGGAAPAPVVNTQFPLTPQGQFNRYFNSSAEDNTFGLRTQGPGVPQNVQQMTTLAQQNQAPIGSPLSSYYRAESAAGRANMPDVVSGLTQNITDPKQRDAMTQWAQANPMLAWRQYNKQFSPTAENPTGTQYSAFFNQAPKQGNQAPGASADYTRALKNMFSTSGNALAQPFSGPNYDLNQVTQSNFNPSGPSFTGGAPASASGFDYSKLTNNVFNPGAQAMTQGAQVSSAFTEADRQRAFNTNLDNSMANAAKLGYSGKNPFF